MAGEAHRNAERYAEWAVKETGMGVVEHKRRKNEACSRGLLEWYGGRDYVSARDRPRREDRRAAAARRRRAGADAVDEPDRHRVLQGAAGADDPKRRRRQPAPAGPRGVGRRRPPPRPGRGRGRRAGRLRTGGRGAHHPADRGAHGRPDHRRDPGDGRRRRRPRRLPLRQPGDRRRPGQRAVPGRPHRRPGRGGRAADGLEELRQLHPVHQRVVRDRRGALRGRVRARARPPRRPCALGRRGGDRCARSSSPRAGCGST